MGRRIRPWLIVGGAAGALVAALWVVPRVMDWDRYRDGISALAAQRLGRPVSIGGHVGLTILPQPVLTAERISVSDPVTGAKFTAREMRLQVGLLALLAGRIDPRALDLDGAALSLPWPVARAGFKMRPPLAFAATIRNGTLTVGGTVISAVNGTLATSGDDSDDGGAVSFGGSARVAGVDWGFDGNLGAIGTDHLSRLVANFTGAGAADGAMLHLNGELNDDGGFAGQMSASGPDLGRLVPAPHVRFSAEARIKAAGTLLQGSDLVLDLGEGAGQGSFQWQDGDPRFSLQLDTSRIDLDKWSAVWLHGGGGGVSSRFDIEANMAQLAHGTLRDVDLDLTLGQSLELRDFSAILPGETAFTAHGTASRNGGDWKIDQGAFTLRTQDITPSLAWLAAADPDLPQPGEWAPLPVDLTADLGGSTLGGSMGAITLAGIKGSVGGVPVAGSMGMAFGDRPRISADLKLDSLALRAFVGLSPSRRLDYDLTIAAKSAGLDGVSAKDLGFHLVRDRHGSHLDQAHATIDGASVTAGFSRAADGSFTDLAFDAKAPSLAPILAELPQGFWHPTPTFAAQKAVVTGDFKGPVGALAGKVAFDSGDLHLVAMPVIDLAGEEARGALTLRDPGAWLLVRQLGGPDVAPWIGVGSLGLLARYDVKPGHLGVDYFDMALGGMRLSGGLGFDEGGGKWSLTGNIASDRLPLAWPTLAGDTQIPTDWVRGGSAKLALSAKSLTIQDGPVASDFHTDLSLADGVFAADNLAFKWGDGTFAGSADWRALDPQPSVDLSGSFANIAITGPLSGGSLDLTSGTAAGKLILTATGYTTATWLATLGGQVGVTVTSGKLVGFDLARAKAAVALPGTLRPQQALMAALKSGGSDFDQLQIAADIKDGGIAIDSGSLTGALNAGLAGSADLPGGVIDLGMTLNLPDGAPPVAARYKGKYLAPAASVDVFEFKKWLVQRSRKKAVTVKKAKVVGK